MTVMVALDAAAAMRIVARSRRTSSCSTP